MKRRVTAVEARKKLGELLDGVLYRGDEVVIERGGKVMGVVIPESRYQSIEQARERIFEFMRANQEFNKDVPAEEIERDIELAIREVRAAKSKNKNASAA